MDRIIYMADNQLTILVKKVDGSQVRMTMDEFKNYVRNTKGTKVRKEEIKTEDKRVNIGKYIRNAKAIEEAEKTAEAKPKQWTEADYKSLLEEENAEMEKYEPLPVLPPKPDDKISKIISELNWNLTPEMSARLYSLILSRLKDIRTDEQVREYASRVVRLGGLGLSDQQVEALISVIKKNISAQPAIKPAVKPEAKIPEKPAEEKIEKNIINFDKLTEAKPIIKDVRHPVIEKKSLGPIDEFQQFTLVDFRRLAIDPEEAVNILKEKLQALKDESYLLYQQAVNAWLSSPLYGQYQSAIIESLNKKQKIENYFLLNAKEQMQFKEFKAIVKLNSSF